MISGGATRDEFNSLQLCSPLSSSLSPGLLPPRSSHPRPRHPDSGKKMLAPSPAVTCPPSRRSRQANDESIRTGAARFLAPQGVNVRPVFPCRRKTVQSEGWAGEIVPRSANLIAAGHSSAHVHPVCLVSSFLSSD